MKDVIDERAFVLLDMNNFEESYQLIKRAISQDWWSQRIEFIRKEKERLLEHMSFCPRVEKVIQEDMNKWIEPGIYNNVCFIHSCTVKEGNTKRLDHILHKLENSELYHKLDKIYVINIGYEISNLYTKKVCILQHSSNPYLYEIPTLNRMTEFSKKYPECNLLYLHNKGISYSDDYQQVNDWIDMMLYFLIDKHEVCMHHLNEGTQVVGSNYSETPKNHFSGNFWWTKASYFQSLPKMLNNIKAEGEYFLFRNKPTYFEIHHSGINHYEMIYPKEKYSD